MFHQTEYDLLLDCLEEGLDSEDYRVRESTLVLIGDLLNGLAGNEGSVSYETNATTHTETRILEYLGVERRNEVFSLLYMARSDGEHPVRHTANITWKGLVYNGSKMLKAILDTLMHALITSLSSKNRERQEAASKSLGDLCKNAGQFIIPKILPILKSGLAKDSDLSDDDDTYKEGIALGLAEVLQNSHPKLLENYERDIIDSIALGICDKLLRVRNASGKAFNIAVKVFGKKCINQIVPNLVKNLDIEGLRQLLKSPDKICETMILPYLIQELLIKSEELEAISLLAADLNDNCYAYLHKYTQDIFTSICAICAQSKGMEDEESLKFGCKIIIDGTPQECMHLLLTTSMDYVNKGDLEVADDNKIVALSLLSAYVKHTENEFEANQYDQVISGLLQLFNTDNDSLRTAAWNTLKDIMAKIPDSELPAHIDWFRQCIRNITDNYKISIIEGFCIKQGLKPVMKMFDYGIRNGSFEERSNAAKLMMDLISLSSLDAVKPFLNKIAGALIRICADRFPANVKCAILQTLSLLINKYGQLMKGFYTPLQTTFVKVIHDPSRDVRADASIAILELMKFSPKFDNLLRDLNNYLKKLDQQNEDDSATNKQITISILNTMSKVLMFVGPKVKPQILNDINNTFSMTDNFRIERDDSLRFAASKCVASIVHCMQSHDDRDEIISNLLDIDEEDDWRSIEYDLNSLAFIIGNDTIYNLSIHESYQNDIQQTFIAFLESQQVLVKIAALRCGYYLVGKIAKFDNQNENDKVTEMKSLLDKHLLPLFSKKVNNDNQDIVISSAEFLLDSILGSGDDNEDDDDDGEGQEVEGDDEKKNNDDDDDDDKVNQVWRDCEIHQVIIPYLIENHLNNIQPELMRKCIVTLLKIDTQQRLNNNVIYFDKFIQNCNQKTVVKELKAIIEAIKQSYR